MAATEIRAYSLDIAAGDKANNVRARIYLYDDKQSSLGVVAFVESGPIPPPALGGAPVGYYPVAAYPFVVDMLRNERPVFLVQDSATDFSLQTQAEKTGEGEPAAGGGVATPLNLKLR